MKSFVVAALVGLALGAASAQTVQTSAPKRTPFRIRVRSADPWLVKAMLESIPVSQPELSTIPGFAGFGSGVAQGLSKLFEGGHLIVNPTDNSIWWIPN